MKRKLCADNDSYAAVFCKRMESDCYGMFDFDLWHFKSTMSNQRYMVRVERYPNHFVAIKFYLYNHRDCKEKYQMLTGFKEPRRVVLTVLRILALYSIEYPNAVFALFAANDVRGGNKRFGFYKRMIARTVWFSDFIKVYDDRGACALTHNASVSEDAIVEFFNQYYSFEE